MRDRFILAIIFLLLIVVSTQYYFDKHSFSMGKDGHIPNHVLLSANASTTYVNPSNWSDPMTWEGAQVPPNNENVTIPAGKIVILDNSTASLGSLIIYGKLIADNRFDLNLTTHHIMVMSGGTLEFGNETNPYSKKAYITLTGPRGIHTPNTEDNSLKNDGMSRAIHVKNNGTLSLIGSNPSLLKTKLNSHASVGSTTFTLADNVQWKAGDKIAISMTDFYTIGETEIFTLAANTSGNILTTTTPLQTFRWGRLQYPTDNGVSLIQGVYTPTDPSSPRVLDERAKVVLLSRNIVVQSINDSDWNNNGFGVHTMVEGLNSTAHAKGIEIVRGGQRRALARYPWHWHMLSYTEYNSSQAGGSYLGDALPGRQYLKDSTVWNSENRAVTIHGSNGVVVDNVFAVDIKGHAFFMEDGSENGNVISNSIAMKARDPGATNRIKVHDQFASGFWLTNPNNTIVNNSGSDAPGRGLWNSFALRPFGLSRNVNVSPISVSLKQFDNNEGHSNAHQGIMTDDVVSDEAGNVGTDRYLYTWPEDSPQAIFTMKNNFIWKNNRGGYVNRVSRARYLNWTAADNIGNDFAGVTSPAALMSGTLLVAESLNNIVPGSSVSVAYSYSDIPKIGLASYHYQLEMDNITAFNYQFVPKEESGFLVRGGGLFGTEDLYTESIGLGNVLNDGWKLINSSAGSIVPAPYFDGFSLSIGGGQFRYWSLPGAQWDPKGYWSPPGSYLLGSNDTFYTYNISNYGYVQPVGQNGIYTTDIYYGLGAIVRNNEDGFSGRSLIPLKASRINENGQEVGEHTIGDPALTPVFPGMRHFTLAKNGRYIISFPGTYPANRNLTLWASNAYRSNDTFLIALPWNGTVPVSAYVEIYPFESLSNGNLNQLISQNKLRLLNNNGTNLNEVVNDASGRTVWQDAANNRVWVKYIGGLNYTYPLIETNFLLEYAKPHIIRLTHDPEGIIPNSSTEPPETGGNTTGTTTGTTAGGTTGETTTTTGSSSTGGSSGGSGGSGGSSGGSGGSSGSSSSVTVGGSTGGTSINENPLSGTETSSEDQETLSNEGLPVKIGLVFWTILAILVIGIVVVGVIIASHFHKRKRFQEYTKGLNRI